MVMRTPAAVLGVLGAVALVLVQFFAWGGISTEGGSAFGFDFPGTSVDAYTWKMKAEAGGNTEKESWYSSDLEAEDDDEDSDEHNANLLKIRIAIPLLMAGLVLAAVGGLLGFLARGPYGILLLVGGILAAIGTVLFALGVDGFFDSDQDWGPSFYLAIVACAVTLVGGVLGLVGGRRGAAT
jgi:hypothetical protein